MKKTPVKFVLAALILFFTLPAAAQSSYDRAMATMTAAKPMTAPQPQPMQEYAEPELPQCETLPFGQSLFEGGTSRPGTSMSSKQQVMPGDTLSLASWGALQEGETTAIVDSQGFVFVKGVGPVHVAGTAEENLSAKIQQEVNKVFHDDVRIYARLEKNTGTPVLVTGGVAHPGQYYGGAQENVLVWLRRAGGILPKQGSYRNIQVQRNGAVIENIDLYSFLQNGAIPSIDWQPGDVIFVGTPQPQIAIGGDVRRCGQFELSLVNASGLEILQLAQPMPGATHAVLKGYRDHAPYANVFSLNALNGVVMQDGDSLSVYAAPQSQMITVTVEGGTLGNKILALPAHTPLSQALDHIPVDPAISDTNAVYIRRASVAKMQKEALEESIDRLLQSALTAPAKSDGEALIRAKEAELIESFAARSQSIEPEGRVVVMRNGVLQDLPLQDGDVIVLPQKTNVVTIEGEVVLPRAVVARKGVSAKEYVEMAGGFTERAEKSEYIVIRPNSDVVRSGSPEIGAGDRLLVLPKVDTKYMQTTKDLVQILYQIAVGAGVVLTIE